MASLLSGTTIGGYTAVHSNNISSYALTSVPANVITTSGGQTIAGITYFSNGESLSLYGIRGRFTNEYIHLYHKVGIGHPGGWGQGEGSTPGYGLSTYGGAVFAYGNNATSSFNGHLRIDRNWGLGDYGAEQFTIRGTYPSITLRSTQHNSKWLIHNDDTLSFYYGGTVDDNSWGRKLFIPTDGNIWMSWAGDYISNLLNAKQNASTAITTSNIGSQSVNYANSAGSAGQVSGVAISGAQATALKKTLDPATLPYSCDIYVEGDANTYYPVHFIWGDQDVWRRIIIKRGYGEEAPWDPIGTGVHHGGLLLDWEGNFGGWGGAEYSDRLRVFNESYTNVCADMYIYTHSMGYVFMLRGGHALYHIYSDQEIRGYNQVGTPDIAYDTTSTYFYENSGAPQYNVRPPAPVTSINSSRIDGLRTKKQSLFDSRYQLASSAINTSNIGSQSVNYASSAGSVAWTNVSSRPTALSQFTNDLGNYGGFLTSLGFSYSTGVSANHVVQRDGNGYIYANHINFNTPETENPAISSFITSNGDGWSRKSSLAHVRNQLGNYGNWITTDGRAYPRRSDGTNINFYWSGQGGQPTWLWGSNDGENFYVWNPSNFSVNYAASAGNSTNLDGRSSSRYLYYRGINAASDFQTYQSSDSVIRFDQVNDYNTHSNPPGGYTYGGVLSMRGGNFGFQLWGSHTGDFYFKTQWNDDQYSGWRYVVHSGNIGSQSVNYATTAGNTNSISNSTGNTHTWTGANYFRTNNGGYLGSLSSAPLQVYSDSNNSAYMSFHKGGYYAVNLGLDADNVMRIGGWSAASNRWELDMSGNNTVAGSFRAPIFYDSADTTYYLDPNAGTSLKIAGGIVSTAANGAVLLKHENSEANAWIFQENAANWGLFWFNAGNQSGQTIGSYTTVGAELFGMNNAVTGFNPNSAWSGTNGDTRASWMLSNYSGYLWTQGTQYSETDMRAPIFYDSQNTAYYLDPNSTSYLYHLVLSGNSYFRPNTWIQFDGNYGVYWPNHYGLHIYPNNDGSYGSLQVKGSKNSWHGIHFDSGNTLMSNANEAGFHQQGVGWKFRWYNGEMYISAGSTGGGTERTVIHSGNIGSQSVSYASSAGGVSWANVSSKPATWLNEPNLIQGSEPDTIRASGFYESYLGSGNPTGTWMNYINVRHSNTANGHGFQLGMSYYDNNLWFRSYSGNIPPSFQSWSRALGTNTDPYPSNMNQYVRTTDDVTHNSTTSPTFVVNNHSDNTKGYRIHNTSGSSVSAMFTNSSNQLVIAAGAFDQINLNKKVYVNGVALGVNVSPSATAGRIDASNDIVAYSSSDERLKQNITPIENAIDKVKSLTGVEFDWKPEYKHAHGYEGHDTGIIAQQVQEVIPSAVRTNDTGFLAVRYEKLIGLLVEGMKEQQAQIEELKAKLDGLTK